ncbi:MAG TPA: hypothetical protein VGJ86_25645 [Acidimicrobiales bacterium]
MPALLIGSLVACSGDDDDTSAGSSTTTSTTASSTSTSTSAPATGCTGPAPQMSEPANQEEIVDVDGDGRRDTAWLASPDDRRELGVLTAAGGGAKVDISSASPTALSLLVADADLEPPVELFVSDGRTVQLWAFDQCSLQPVTDAAGAPYQFDLGFRGYGTGVGCVDADGDGKRDLVGLNVTSSDDATVDWSRTIIERDGLRASNGATDTGRFQQGQDAGEIELLYGVTCGDLTMNRDGIRQPEP